MNNGVFCLEGFWYGDHRDSSTVKPVLDLLNSHTKLPYVYHRCSTVEEFNFSLSRWRLQSFHNKYPLLWLAFHGEPGKILIGKDEITITQLADILEDKCIGSIIYFGSCSTMKWDKRSIQTFMEKTQTVAMLGYKRDVEWLPSASFEIQLLSYFQDLKFITDNVTKIKESVLKDCKALCSNLQFRFEINNRQRFTPKRVKVTKRK